MLEFERPCRAQSARLPLEATRSHLLIFLIYIVLFPVPQHGIGFHADIQPDLHDVVDRALVWLSSVPRSYAARISTKLLGCNKRTTGQYTITITYRIIQGKAKANANRWSLSCIMIILIYLYHKKCYMITLKLSYTVIKYDF